MNAGKLIPFDLEARRRRSARSGQEAFVDDAGSRYEIAMEALLEILDEEDAYLVDELDHAVVGLLRSARHPSAVPTED